jgi:hypothetical protein
MQVALHTVLKAGHEADYDAVHAEIPAALAAKLRASGVRDWRIWRDGPHVFHLVDVEDYATCGRRCPTTGQPGLAGHGGTVLRPARLPRGHGLRAPPVVDVGRPAGGRLRGSGVPELGQAPSRRRRVQAFRTALPPPSLLK